jgi:CRISPR/Cas system-associated exonuclease Cas4 (RecB family)
MRDSRAPRTPDKEKRRYNQHRAASDFVGESSGDKCAHRATEEERGHVESRTEIRSVKRPVERVHRAIDDAAVETKKKTTQSRDGRNRDDVKPIAPHLAESFRE